MRALVGLAALCIVADQVGAATGLTATDGWRAAVVGRLDAGVAVIVVTAACWVYLPLVARAADSGGASTFTGWRARVAGWVLPLWIVIAVTFLVTQRTESVADWIRHMTLVQTFSYYHIHGALSHLWPLAVVAQFALIVSLGGLRAKRRTPDRRRTTLWHLAVAALLVAIGVAFRIWIHDRVLRRPVLQWLPASMDWLGLGIVLAVVADRSRETPLLRGLRACAAAPGTCWSAAGLVWLLATTKLASVPDFSPIVPWQQTSKHMLDGLAAFFVVLPVVAGPVRKRSPRLESVTRLLGSVSYGILLWQLPVLLAVQDRLGLRPFGGGFFRLWSLTTLGAIACAWVTRFVVAWVVGAGSAPQRTWQPRPRTSSGSPVRP